MRTILFFPIVLLIGLNFLSGVDGQFVPILEWVRSFFGAYEEPPYTSILNITEGIEVRDYPAQNWSCVEEFLPYYQKESKDSEMFMSLYSYIQGKNDNKLKIPMTIPISTKVDHRNGDLYSYEMCFYLPQIHQSDPPKPTSSNVKIVERPRMKIYSKQFGGYATSATFNEQLLELSNVLKEKKIRFREEGDYERTIHFINGYDSPTKFWSRRNELWLLAPK